MKKILVLLVALFTFLGCAQLTQLMDNKPLLVKTSVQLATVEYLKFNPHRVEPMTKNISIVRDLVESGELGTVDLVANKIKELINNDTSMIPEEILLANNIVDLFAQEAKDILIAQGYFDDVLTVENKETALQVLSWITDAVNLMRNRV